MNQGGGAFFKRDHLATGFGENTHFNGDGFTPGHCVDHAISSAASNDIKGNIIPERPKSKWGLAGRNH